MRPAVLLVLFSLLLAACGWFKHEEIQFTFNNQTDSTTCIYTSPEDASAEHCLDELNAAEARQIIFGCGDGPGIEHALISVVISVKEGGRRIYERTAECRIWQASDRTFVIEQRGDNFGVTDPLSDVAPNPESRAN